MRREKEFYMEKTTSAYPSPAAACLSTTTAGAALSGQKGGSRRSTRVVLVFLTGKSLRIHPSNKHDNTVHSLTTYCIGLMLTISVCRRISKVAQVVVDWRWVCDVEGQQKKGHNFQPPLRLVDMLSSFIIIQSSVPADTPLE